MNKDKPDILIIGGPQDIACADTSRITRIGCDALSLYKGRPYHDYQTIIYWPTGSIFSIALPEEPTLAQAQAFLKEQGFIGEHVSYEDAMGSPFYRILWDAPSLDEQEGDPEGKIHPGHRDKIARACIEWLSTINHTLPSSTRVIAVIPDDYLSWTGIAARAFDWMPLVRIEAQTDNRIEKHSEGKHPVVAVAHSVLKGRIDWPFVIINNLTDPPVDPTADYSATADGIVSVGELARCHLTPEYMAELSDSDRHLYFELGALSGLPVEVLEKRFAFLPCHINGQGDAKSLLITNPFSSWAMLFIPEPESLDGLLSEVSVILATPPEAAPEPVDSETTELHKRRAPKEGNVFRRTGDYWEIVYDGSALSPVRHLLGMTYIQTLISHADEDISARDLYEKAHPPPPESLSHVSVPSDGSQSISDGGQRLIDEKALKALRERDADIKAKLASDDVSITMKEELTDELAKIDKYLMSARVSSPTGGATFARAEQKEPRQAVCKAIDTALDSIGRAEDGLDLARHLRNAIQKGTTLRYIGSTTWST